MHVAVIGAGIAGLSTAWRLKAHGVRQVTVLEREALAFSHSSARNAAIFRPLEANDAVVRLVAASDELLNELSNEPLVQRTGLLLTARVPSSLDELLAVATRTHVPHEYVTGAALTARHPELFGGRSTSAVWLPRGGVMDIHRVSESLRARLRDQGADVHLNAEVTRIEVVGGSVRGVTRATGETIECDAVVIAAGAWAEPLGASAGAPLSLTPHRRHLALMLPTSGLKLPSMRPVVWDMETGIYFRPESAGVLACPGDHEPVVAGVPAVNHDALDVLAERLPALCPELASYALVRPWACLRTMTPSKTMVIGADPRVSGLFWFAGLGGQGMSAGLGGADVLARLVAAKELAGTRDPAMHTFSVEQHLGVASKLDDGAQP